MENDFYRNLEDQFRGSRESIKNRVSIYQDFLVVLKENLPEHRALDLGCGRGELLEVLTESGFDATGVDIDEGMLRACKERHLTAHQQDALEALRACKSDSLAIVCALHIVEHLPLETLLEIIGEAHRALMPGGLLLMETPNPENIYTGLVYFHMDPSHLKPIPPELLTFMAKQSGFENNSVLRLNQGGQVGNTKNPSVQDVVFGVSPDYAVLAQKKGRANIHRRVDTLVKALSGKSLWDRVKAYDNSQSRFTSAALHGAAMAETLQSDIQRLERMNEKLNQALSYLQDELAALRSDHENVWNDINGLKQANALIWQTFKEQMSHIEKVSRDAEASQTLSRREIDSLNAKVERIASPIRKIMSPLRWAFRAIKKILGR